MRLGTVTLVNVTGNTFSALGGLGGLGDGVASSGGTGAGNATPVFNFGGTVNGSTTTGAIPTAIPNAAPATHFTLVAQDPATASQTYAGGLTVTARDATNAVATNYNGTVHITSSDSLATIGGNDIQLTNGVGSFTTTLRTSGSQSFTATDLETGTITGTVSVTVVPSPAVMSVSFNPTTVGVGADSIMTVTVTNPNTVALTNVQFNNTMPAGLTLITQTGGTAGTLLGTGGGSFSINPAGGVFSSTSNTLAAGASATIIVQVRGATLGAKVDTTSTVTSSEAAAGAGGTATLTVIQTAQNFSVSAPGLATAGTAFNVTVTALDSLAATATNYTGTVHFTSSDGAAVLPADATLTNGVGTFSVTLKTAGSRTITATDTVTASITGTSGGTTVNAAAATHLAVVAPGTATAASAFSFTVTALDVFNNTATGYAGTVHVTSTDGAAVLPANSTLTNGVGTLTATLKTAGNQTLTATDTVTGSINGTSGAVTVNPGPATHFSASAPGTAAAGVAFNVTVTALDVANNTATGYAGTVHFTSTDGQAVLPANSTLTNGVGTFSATLKTAGSQTVTATDTVTASITGTSGTVTVSPGAATHLGVAAPGTVTAASAFSFTVTALDAFNNTATGYAGTVHLTSTDGAAVLPADTTLTNGVGTLSATLKTAGSRTLTATDTVTGSITGTSGAVTVNPGPATHFAVSAPGTGTAGIASSITVTALDVVNNTATGYAGTVHFTSTDGQVVLPANSTLTNGAGTFSATLKTAGSQTVTATDTVTASITGTSGAVTVSPGAAAQFGFAAPGTAAAGTAFNVTVTALDAFNNTVPTYAGTVALTSTDVQAVLPANSTLTSGVKTFSVTLKTAGAKTVTATDTVTGSITGTSAAVTVTPGPATRLGVTAPGSTTAGVAVSVTATAFDAFNNTATAYTGTVHFTTGDGQAALPANSTLTAGTGTFSATLKTAGSQTITATDTVTGSITGVSGTIAVSPAAPDHFIVVASPTALQAGSGISISATVVDAFSNTVPTYAGTVRLGSSDPAAALPAGGAFVNGRQSFNGILRTPGTHTVSVTDTVTPAITGSATVSVAVLPPVAASVIISNTAQTFDGGQKTVTVATVPAGLTTTVTYNGSATAPSALGTYTVVATVVSAGFTGSATATLTIARATQIVTFTPAAGLKVGEAFTLRATASSGLPVTFTLVSGNSTLTGATLTPADSNPIVVRATQAGNDTYGAISVEQTITDIAKAVQTITFAALADKSATDAPFAISATASSGLPVSLAVVSGPATISGGTVTLAGPAGAVVIRATQAGNAAYAAAPTVDRAFTVIEVNKRVLGHFINVSARARAGAGGQTFIVGFVLGGTASRQMLVRGVGPGLAQFGVPGTVANPAIRIEGNGTLIAQNDDWDVAGAGTGIAAAAVSAGAFALQRGSTDAAVLSTLPVGGYTAQLTTPNGDTGIALAEMYEAGTGAVIDPHMLNFSVRAAAGSGDATMIVGFVVTGDVPTKILVRAVGPGLAQFGVTGALTDPLLTVFSGPNAIASNSDWNIPSGADAADAAQKSGAFPLTPGSKDAAVVIMVPPGAYTVKLTGAEGGSGVALVEVYEVP